MLKFYVCLKPPIPRSGGSLSIALQFRTNANQDKLCKRLFARTRKLVDMIYTSVLQEYRTVDEAVFIDMLDISVSIKMAFPSKIHEVPLRTCFAQINSLFRLARKHPVAQPVHESESFFALHIRCTSQNKNT